MVTASVIAECDYCRGRTGGCNGWCTLPPAKPGMLPSNPIVSVPVPKGCICPAGANLTCERPDCGRKPPEPR